MVFRKETVYAHAGAADVLWLADHAIACGQAFEAWLATATAAHPIDPPTPGSWKSCTISGRGRCQSSPAGCG